MIIVGERINTTRKSIRKAVEERDTGFIQDEAKKQADAGANYIDVNSGTSVKNEVEDMKWLVETVQAVVELPLCIDSPNPEALEAGLAIHKGKPIINSITGEQSRMEMILPLVEKYKTSVVALTMDETGMPHTAAQRTDIAKKIVDAVVKRGIAEEDIYFDALVRPISTEPKQAIEFLDSLKGIKSLGKVKTICGLSNISFGLPKRGLINAAFLNMAVYAGLDAALIDPLDKGMLAAVKISDALLGRDEFCLNYIAACRSREFKE